MLGRIDITVQGSPQSVLLEVNEGSIQKLSVRALDADLAAATPSSARYRIDNLTTGEMVKTWTALTPSTAMDILISATDNALQSCYSRERRQVLIEASDADGPIRITHEYDLINLAGVP